MAHQKDAGMDWRPDIQSFTGPSGAESTGASASHARPGAVAVRGQRLMEPKRQHEMPGVKANVWLLSD